MLFKLLIVLWVNVPDLGSRICPMCSFYPKHIVNVEAYVLFPLCTVFTCQWLSRFLPCLVVFCFLLSEFEVLEQPPKRACVASPE